MNYRGPGQSTNWGWNGSCVGGGGVYQKWGKVEERHAQRDSGGCRRRDVTRGRRAKRRSSGWVEAEGGVMHHVAGCGGRGEVADLVLQAPLEPLIVPRRLDVQRRGHLSPKATRRKENIREAAVRQSMPPPWHIARHQCYGRARRTCVTNQESRSSPDRALPW